MPRTSSSALRRVVESVATLTPPRNRDLVRGMVAELESIHDPLERIRFALGALVAVVRLAVRGHGRAAITAILGGPSMSTIPSRRLLGRHALPFAVSLVALTALLLANFAVPRLQDLGAAGLPGGSIGELLLFSLPHTLALTIPMAVLLSVSWVFMRLGKEGVLASAGRGSHGVRQLLVPVLGAAAVVAASTLVLNTEVVPRANARLAEVLTGAPIEPNDRTMTVGQLRDAAGSARAATGADAQARAARYDVEIQKKFALAFACMILALAGAATAIRFPRGGAWLMLASTCVVFFGYYLALSTGESLADRQVIPPVLAMWMANALLLAVAVLLLRPRSRPAGTPGTETLVVGGA